MHIVLFFFLFKKFEVDCRVAPRFGVKACPVPVGGNTVDYSFDTLYKKIQLAKERGGLFGRAISWFLKVNCSFSFSQNCDSICNFLMTTNDYNAHQQVLQWLQ